MGMDSMDKYLSELESNGFSNIPCFFDKDEIKSISEEAAVILEGVDFNEISTQKSNNGLRNYNTNVYYNGVNVLTTSLLGKSKIIDDFMRRFFDDDRLVEMCEKVVGKNFRIYSLGLRQITPNSRALSLHQDSFGIFSLSIPLNDVTSNEGTTLFLPKSHLYPLSISNKLFSVPASFFEFMCTPHLCNLGDLGLFFTKTFHAARKGSRKSTVILIGLVGEEGISYKPWSLPDKTNYGMDFREAVGEKLYSKLGSSEKILKFGDLWFTAADSMGSSHDNKNIEPVCLHKGFGGRKMLVFPSILNSKDKRLINRIQVKKLYSIKSIVISCYCAVCFALEVIINKASKIKRVLLPA